VVIPADAAVRCAPCRSRSRAKFFQPMRIPFGATQTCRWTAGFKLSSHSLQSLYAVA
jgi:hypothetical protein